MPHIRTVLYDQYRLEECMNEINGLRAGLIRIGTFNSVSAQWLPGIIRSFHADYPAIRFELLHGTNEQIEEWIRSGRVDIGFIKYPPADTRFIESDDHAVVAMVEQGLGTSLMSMMMIQGFSRRIAAIPLEPPAWRDLGIGFRDRKSLSGAAAAFLQCTRQWLAENGYHSEGSSE